MFLVGGLVSLRLSAAESGIPAEDFFRPPEMTSPQISPDGTHVAFIRSEGWKTLLGVQEIGSGKLRIFEPAKSENVSWVRWASDRRLIFGVNVDYDRGSGSTVYTTAGLFAVDLDGKRPRNLYAYSARLINLLPDDPDHVLADYGGAAYQVNVHTGAHTLLQGQFAHVFRWTSDSAGEIRLGMSLEEDRQDLYFRAKGAKEFARLRSLTLESPDFSVLGFDDADESLWVESNEGRDTTALFHFDPKSRELGPPVVAEERFDFDGSLRLTGDRRRAVGVSYFTDRPRFHALDPKEEQFQKRLDDALPGTFNSVVSQSRDGSLCTVTAYSDVQSGDHYLCRREPFGLVPLGSSRPWLNPGQLRRMLPIHFQSADGLKVHGYVTLPRSVPGRKPPMVVLPHGGPWARDYWGFDPEVQFLANRGYSVLQINFRGSTGFGQKFLAAGFRQWGKSMQDDITTGIRWAVQEGAADPARIAIYGASYGGYAAMSGLCFTPELFRCGINACGVTDIRSFIAGIPKRQKLLRSNMEKLVGDPKAESDEMKANSPLYNIDRIQAPVLLVYGRNDPIVDIKQGDRFARALRKQGREVVYLEYPKEGHGFHHRKNRLNFYGEVERFLDRHLGAGSAAKP